MVGRPRRALCRLRSGRVTDGGCPRPVELAALAGLAAATGLRLWVIRTLGTSWNVTAHVPPDVRCRDRAARIATIRHPNYVAVALEFLCLPLAVGAVPEAVILSRRQRRGAGPADSRRGAPARWDPGLSRGLRRRSPVHPAAGPAQPSDPRQRQPVPRREVPERLISAVDGDQLARGRPDRRRAR